MTIEKKSLERVGFAAIVSLTLAPVILSLIHYLFVYLIGGDGDSYQLVFASSVIGGSVGLTYFFLSKQNLFVRLGIVWLISIILSIALGNGFQSKLTIALMLGSLGICLSLFLPWLTEQLPVELDGLAKQYKIRTALFLLLAIFTIYQTASLSVFMNNSEYVEASAKPDIPFLNTHSCLTAYVHALKLIKEGTPNFYDPINWPHGSTENYSPFHLDAFMYPPPFLLLPASLFSMTDSFQVQRAIWFGFSGLLVAFGFWAVAKWTSAKNEWHSIFLIYLAWSSLTVLITLQVGNIHHVTMATAVLGMFAFERKLPAVGGALLAFAIVSKISPGLLGIILLVQRRWRDAAWTFAFGIIYIILSILIFGIKPMQDFVIYEIPRLSSGEAMYWLDKEAQEILINAGPFGIPFRLGLLGVNFDNPWRVGKIFSTIYTVLIVMVTAYISLKEKNPRQKVCFWLGVLTMAGLQSPFAPGYVLIPLLWAITIFAAEIKNTKGVILLAAGWILLTLVLPVPPTPVTIAVIYYLFQQVICFITIAIMLTFKSKNFLSNDQFSMH